MISLYDVFSAICADEGDHVSTMAACLDPEASLQSPSLERRVLTGVALLALAPYLASSILDASTGDTAAAGLADAGTVAEMTGAAALVRQLLGQSVEGDMTETSTILRSSGEALRQFFTLLLRFFR